jgi:hypothetical protein
MKKIALLLVCFTLFFVEVQAQKKNPTVTAKSKKTLILLPSFRDIVWGSHVDSVYTQNGKVFFTRSMDIGNRTAYLIPGDNMIIGTVLLDNIYYIFNNDDRFIGVQMFGKRDMGNRKQVGEMRYILTFKYGEPETKELNKGVQYFWNIDDVRITLDDDESKGLFKVEFLSDFERTQSKRINMNVSDF